VDARKWVAAKLLPKKYSDVVEHTGEVVSKNYVIQVPTMIEDSAQWAKQAEATVRVSENLESQA
jgi:hypothetical protein